MRLAIILPLAFFPFVPAAGAAEPAPAPAPVPAPAGGLQPAAQALGQPYGGCYGCSYVGDWRPSPGPRRPAPPPRLQGAWRNGWWYY